MRILIVLAALGLPLTATAATAGPAENHGLPIGGGVSIGEHHSEVYGIVSYPTLGVGYLAGIGEGADVAVDAQLNFRSFFNTFQFGPWVRYSFYDEDNVAFAARFRLNGLLTLNNNFGGSSLFFLQASPGVAMSIAASPLTDISIDADIPFYFFFVSPGGALVGVSLTAGVDRYVPKLKSSFGLFLGINPVIANTAGPTGGFDVGFQGGVRGQFAL